MIAQASKLVRRVTGALLVFSLGTAALVASVAPRWLLVESSVVGIVGWTLLVGVGAGGLLTLGRGFWIMRKHRFVLRALALGSRSVQPYDLQQLSEVPQRLALEWLLLTLASLTTAMTVWRPVLIGATTASSLALLAAVFVAAAALPLHVLIRSAVVRAVELAPPEVMRELFELAEKGAVSTRRAPRLVLAIATPVALVAVGSALIANAHLRRVDHSQREESARVLARASLEQVAGVPDEEGVREAMSRIEEDGFRASLGPPVLRYRLERGPGGAVKIYTPLDTQSAQVRFRASTIGILSGGWVAVALVALIIAVVVGVTLSRALATDLNDATQRVGLLGMEDVLRGRVAAHPSARFLAVAELGRAVDQLADRFRVFAKAQERAIMAREASTRMRGLFFASVSHDLKSPLNAILGFTHLVRSGTGLSLEQLESLDLIERSGRELLALIETILDAARVEAGQLTLVVENVAVNDLVGEAMHKGRDLTSGREVPVIGEVEPSLPDLEIDRVHMTRALATFLAYGVRSCSQGETVRLRALSEGRGTKHKVLIEVVMPSGRISVDALRAMLDPSAEPGVRQHRGLALGLSLAKSVVELHSGVVSILDHQDAGIVVRTEFAVTPGL